MLRFYLDNLLWILKESYINADGRGLSLVLNSYSIDIKNDEISVITNNELHAGFFRKYDIDNIHIFSVCSLDKSFNIRIMKVNV